MATGTTALRAAARDAASCRACPLWERATQTVFGEGPPDASLVLVGASRGVQLEVEGRPLVATIHPSAVLRARGHDERVASFDGLVADLVRARRLLAS